MGGGESKRAGGSHKPGAFKENQFRDMVVIEDTNVLLDRRITSQ